MMRVCVVGCGQSGLASIKSCLEQGLEVVAYEQDDSIGKFITILPTAIKLSEYQETVKLE